MQVKAKEESGFRGSAASGEAEEAEEAERAEEEERAHAAHEARDRAHESRAWGGSLSWCGGARVKARGRRAVRGVEAVECMWMAMEKEESSNSFGVEEERPV